MNTFSKLAVSFVFLASLSTPLFASADCSAVTCPSGQTCVQYSATDFGCTVSGAVSASGAGSVNQQWAVYYKDTVVWFVNSILVPALIAISFIVFLWGVYKYFIFGAADEKSRTEGRQFVLWGVIGFVVITSVWGLVNMVKDTIVPTSASSTRPNFPTL